MHEAEHNIEQIKSIFQTSAKFQKYSIYTNEYSIKKRISNHKNKS
jgi:hypothetical protein